MANFSPITDSIQEKFNNILDTRTSIPQDVNFELFCDLKLKTPYKVIKSNDLQKHKTDVDVSIIINEEIFNELTVQQQDLMIEEMLMYIIYDSETGKVTLYKPEIFYDFMVKYQDEYSRLIESLKSIADTRRQKEEEAKADKAGKKGKFGK